MGADGARKRKIAVIAALAAAVVLLALLELLVGSSGMSVRQCVSALFGSGDSAAVRIMQHIRLPRLLAAVIAGAGLSVSGLIMQTVLGNPMASPATLGVSNAAVFGANLSIIALSGGFLSTGNNLTSYTAGADPFATSALAFVFAAGSVLVVLALCRLRDFSPNVVVLAGIALGSVWTAATTILQFYATDVGLSAAVIWSFGDLGRATYRADWIMLAVTAAGITVFAALAWRYNALLSGGVILGAFFMATDYVTTPMTKKGKLVFGLGCAVLTFVIREFANMPEGCSFSILLMNLLTPYIDRFTVSKPLGAKPAERKAKDNG